MKKKNNKKKRKKKGGNKCFDYWTLPAATPSTTFSLYLSLSFSLSAATPSPAITPTLFISLLIFFFLFLPPPTPKSLVNSLSLSLSTIQPPCIRGYMSWQETFFFFFLFIFPWMQMAANLPSRARRTYLFICWYAFFSNDLSIVFNCGVLKKSRIFWEGETKILINFWIISICSIQCV